MTDFARRNGPSLFTQRWSWAYVPEVQLDRCGLWNFVCWCQHLHSYQNLKTSKLRRLSNDCLFGSWLESLRPSIRLLIIFADLWDHLHSSKHCSSQCWFWKARRGFAPRSASQSFEISIYHSAVRLPRSSFREGIFCSVVDRTNWHQQSKTVAFEVSHHWPVRGQLYLDWTSAGAMWSTREVLESTVNRDMHGSKIGERCRICFFMQVARRLLIKREILSHWQAFNIFTDLVLAILPSVVVSNLNMRVRTKVGLIFLMSLGVLWASCPRQRLTHTDIIVLVTW